MNLNTGFYEKGILIKNRKRILWNYIKGWFFLDFASTIPIDFIMNNFLDYQKNSKAAIVGKSSKLIRILKFLRFLRMIRLLRAFKLKEIFLKIEEYLQLSAVLNAILSLIKLAVIIIIIAHWCACFWYFIATIYENDNNNWIKNNAISNDSWYEKYTTSIYFSIATMMTVGYGDVIPKSPYEKIVAIIMMIISNTIFGYTMSKIGMIFDSLDVVSKINRFIIIFIK